MQRKGTKFRTKFALSVALPVVTYKYIYQLSKQHAITVCTQHRSKGTYYTLQDCRFDGGDDLDCYLLVYDAV